MQFPDPDTPLVPIARFASEPVHKVPGGASWARVRDTYPRYIEKVIRARTRARRLVCWCVSRWRAAVEVEVCRQSRLRGRIHARPSAGGLAALRASRFFLSLTFFLSSSSHPVPFFHQRSRPDPGPRTPFESRVDRHRRVARVPIPVPPRYYLQFARYRVQV